MTWGTQLSPLIWPDNYCCSHRLNSHASGNTRWIENETNPHDHDALDKDGHLLPTGQALKIWGNFLGSQMIKSNTTGMILSFASIEPVSNTLFLYLVNKGDQTVTINPVIEKHKIVSIPEACELFGTSSEDIHPVWQQVKKIKPGKPVILKGISITVLKMKIVNSHEE